jgi:uracil-DNA glycosylase family 4
MIVREPNCAACPLSKNGKMPSTAVFGKGPLYDPDLVIVGEGPGKEEEVAGEPFIGRSGKLLDEGIRLAKGDRSRIRIDNATLCRPPSGSSVELRLEAAKCCWPRLESELKCNNAPIIAYGRVAAEVIRQAPCNVVEDNGTSFKWDNRHVIMSLHPAYILRQRGVSKHPDGYLWAMTAHIRNALELVKQNLFVELRDEDIQVFLGPDQEAFNALQELYEEAKRDFGFLAVDTEAHSNLPKPYLAKHPMAAVIDMFGFATPKRAIAVKYPSAVLQSLIEQILKDEELGKVFHNLPYDLTSLRRHGFGLAGHLGDTLLEHHAIFPGAKHALQQAATYWVIAHAWKSEYRDKKDTPEDRARYCAFDTLATARMHYRQQPLLDELGLREMHENDLFNAKLASRMTLVGMPVDEEENKRLGKVFQEKIDEHLGRIKARLEGFGVDLWRFVAAEQARFRRKKDPEDYNERVEKRFAELQKELDKGKLQWNYNSETHLGAYCFMVGHPITVRTEKGHLSTADEVLRELAAKSPEIMSLRVLLENQKAKGTFIDPIFDREVVEKGKTKLKRGWAINGRVHPVWSVNKLPGRWGSAMNGVMNIPKEDLRRGRPNLRSQYKSLPGKVQVGFDYQALHPRIIAALSGDSFLKKVFREGRDIHGETAGGVWGNEYKLMKCPEPCSTCTRSWLLVGTQAHEKPQCQQREPCKKKCEYCAGVEGTKLKMCARKKRMRDSIKAPAYTWYYRGTVHTAWLQACEETPGLPIANVERMFAGLKRTMPSVWAWQERLLRQAAERPFEIRDAAGWRRLTFHLGEPTPSDIVNFPVLATETYLMHMGLRKIAPRLREYKYCETIHYGSDAVTWEVNEDEADRLMVDVPECFEIVWKGIPFPIEIAKGQSLAET